MAKWDWETLRRDHRTSVDAFLQAAQTIDASRWSLPRAEGKWSPAEVAEHIRLAYEALLKELGGKGGMKIKTSWWQRALLNLIFKPRLLATGSFPAGVRAPREARPGAVLGDRTETLAAIRSMSEEFDEKMHQAAQNGGARLTHPYFGRVKADEVMRFCAVHNEHHRKQLV